MAILLIMTFSGQMVVQASLMIRYMLQYEYYAEQLCENKNSSELNCQGTCALSQQMIQATQSSAEDSEQIPVEDVTWICFALDQDYAPYLIAKTIQSEGIAQTENPFCSLAVPPPRD